MKRKDILNKKNSKEELINVSSIIRKDTASIQSMKSSKKLELIDIEDKIETYLKNEKLNIDEQFVTLVKEYKIISRDLEILSGIEEDYL